MINKLSISFWLFILLLCSNGLAAQNADSLKNSLSHLPERPKDDIYDTLRCKILDQLGELSEGEAWRKYSEQLRELCEIRLKKTGKDVYLKNSTPITWVQLTVDLVAVITKMETLFWPLSSGKWD